MIDLKPAPTFSINGSAPGRIADVDERFDACLECVIDGQYGQLPLAAISRLDAPPPRQAHDLLWIPALIKLVDGSIKQAFLFARYPDSETAADPLLTLGRRTDFDEQGRGIGQHVLSVGDDELGILEVRTLVAAQELPIAEFESADALTGAR